MAAGTHSTAQVTATSNASEGHVDRALDELTRESSYPWLQEYRRRLGRRDKRALLGDLLISHDAPHSEAVLAATDAVWTTETASAPAGLQCADDSLPGLRLRCGPTRPSGRHTEVVVWRGDVRCLVVDAVVNAANEAGLGCFQPAHKCIDNILHRAAGPRLREECRRCMASRAARAESGPPASPALLVAGSAPMVTGAYHLPAKAVCHVTGPQITDPNRFKVGPPTSEERRKLAACYRGVLTACNQQRLRSVAFCCVSTGLFGYPSKDAAELALCTVQAWLSDPAHSDHSIDLVVFDVFTDEDEDWYNQLAPTLISAG